MASSSSASAGHEKYYVPESSSLAIRATIGLILSVFGAALVLNDMTYGNNEGSSNSVWVLTAGLVFFHLHAGQLVWHCHPRKSRGDEQQPAPPELCLGNVLVHFL